MNPNKIETTSAFLNLLFRSRFEMIDINIKIAIKTEDSAKIPISIKNPHATGELDQYRYA